MVKMIEGRGAADLAKRAMQNVGHIFRYAVAHGYAKRNPASEIRPADVLRPTHKATLARIDAKEFPALLRAIEVYQGTHVTCLAIKLMALTFTAAGHSEDQRVGNLALMKVEKVRRAVVGFKYGQALSAKVRVDLLAEVEGLFVIVQVLANKDAYSHSSRLSARCWPQ
jgi:hypothetical protein